MEESSAHITVYIPSDLEQSPPHASSHFPCLEKLISRGETVQIPHLGDAHMLTLFGGDSAGGTARAAVSHYVQYASSGDGQWRIIASPVHLVADHATLHFPPQNHSLLNDEESQALMVSCQDHFAEEGWRLEYGAANTWYLWIDGTPNISTTPLDDAIGNPLFEMLPQGDDAQRWRRWSNEAQMLLHAHAVNDARQARGQAPINSLWFWGEGRLPALTAKRFERVFGGDRYVQGLAQLSRAQWSPLVEGLSVMNDSLQHSATLIVLDEANRPRWDRAWFCPLAKKLRASAIDSLVLNFRNGYTTQLNPSMLRRFWRRKRFSIAATESAL
ncbi:MAG TPA: hypothetical protein VGE00_05535 [Gammaproteobacteria bacterium]